MNRHSIVSAGMILLLWVLPLHAQQASQQVSMSQVWNSLPDFVCKEKIVSSTVEKGKAKGQRTIESVFMTQRKTQTRPDGTNVYSMAESRELVSIDGKAASKDARMPSAPLFFDGLAANILFIADGPRRIGGPAANLEGRLAMRIGFTTKDSKEFLHLEFPAAVTAVQMDTQSSKTLHVESKLGTQYAGRGVPVSADFQIVEIDGNAYWLPRLVKAEATLAKDESLRYSAEYTDCKKFEVKVQIRPANVP